MFSEAYAIASEFTWPAIISVRRWDGSVECGLGAFVILNEDGWMVTAAHLWDSYHEFDKHKQEISQYKEQLHQIETDPALSPKQKRKRKDKVQLNPRWITHHSFWWGKDGVRVDTATALKPADSAIGRLEPFEKSWVARYPRLKDPTKGLRPGTSLCKLGFPFYEINATYDDVSHRFMIPDGTLPVPRFPIEGIYTRNVLVRKAQGDIPDIKLIETSSPGLRGQSGGPVFDVDGTVWSIQSLTQHLELGFRPKVRRNGREVEENQFLNVGLGVHPETLVWFLVKNGVKIAVSDY